MKTTKMINAMIILIAVASCVGVNPEASELTDDLETSESTHKIDRVTSCTESGEVCITICGSGGSCTKIGPGHWACGC
jgi:hypothetical protein